MTSAKVATDTLDAADLAADSVAASELADNAVDSAAIAADTLAAADLAADSVASSELADNAVDTAAIQADAVTSAKIAAGAVGKTDINPSGMVSSVTIDPPSITSNNCTVVNTAITGVTPGDIVIFNADTQEDGLFAEAAEQDHRRPASDPLLQLDRVRPSTVPRGPTTSSSSARRLDPSIRPRY